MPGLTPPSQIIDRAMNLVKDYIDNKLKEERAYTVFVVWFSKTLQNWKALISTTLPDDMYYEVTYNGDKLETYIDVYKKVENIRVSDYPAITGLADNKLTVDFDRMPKIPNMGSEPKNENFPNEEIAPRIYDKNLLNISEIAARDVTPFTENGVLDPGSDLSQFKLMIDSAPRNLKSVAHPYVTTFEPPITPGGFKSNLDCEHKSSLWNQPDPVELYINE